MHNFKYVIYREGEYYVAQCLNVDVSSFGSSIDEAIANIKDAVTLYLRGETSTEEFHSVEESLIGEATVYA
jgi:predicted RNase H-like HicB family nuclease